MHCNNIMDQQKFEKKMDELTKPDVGSVKPPEEIKLAILSAQRSATLGIWFIVVPTLFLIGMVMKYEMNVDLGLIDGFERIMVTLDRNPATKWTQPVLIIILPAVGVMLNLLAITHFKWDSLSRLIMLSYSCSVQRSSRYFFSI
jgi:hypothetical protein